MHKLAITSALCAAISFLSASSIAAGDKLSDVLRESKWDDVIGTWVDPETNGKAHRATYAWKIEDRVIEITSRQGKQSQISLMGVNAQTGDVFHMGADSEGASSLGKWHVDDDGDAILELLFTAGDGSTGGVRIRHHREDKDTMLVTIELPEPITFKLVRLKAKD